MIQMQELHYTESVTSVDSLSMQVPILYECHDSHEVLL